MNKLSSSEEVALLHCAAGLHRTGMTTYTILRVIGGLGADDAYKALRDMREATYEEVCDWRVDLAEQYLVPHFLGKNEKITHRVQKLGGEEETIDSIEEKLEH